MLRLVSHSSRDHHPLCDIFPDHRTELEAFGRPSACKPDILEIRMTVDDEIARSAELVMTRARFQYWSVLHERESKLEKVLRQPVVLAFEDALAGVGIGRDIAAHAHPETAIIRRKGG